MELSVIQLPANNTGANTTFGTSPSQPIKLVVPTKLLQEVSNDLFNDDLGNWNDYDDFNTNNYTNSGLNSSSPFIRNFFKNIYNGNSSWNNNSSTSGGSRSSRAKRRLKAFLVELLKACSGQGSSNIQF